MNKVFTWLVPILLTVTGFLLVHTLNTMDNKIGELSADVKTLLSNQAISTETIQNNRRDIDRLNQKVFSMQTATSHPSSRPVKLLSEVPMLAFVLPDNKWP